MILLKNISLTIYPEKKILTDISWQIKKGENWILFGKNGSGKSKLLQIITGYQCPSLGEIIRFGKPTIGSDVREIRKKIGYVGTYLKEQFNRNDTVTDVIVSGLFASIGLYENPSHKDIKYAHELLDSIKMLNRSKDKFKFLSDGEKQKILTLRAIINKPDLLILDEPTMGLDIASREDLLFSLETISTSKNIEMIYVTHHIEEITPFFNKLFIIHDGMCYYQGNITEGLTDKNLNHIFNKEIKVEKINGRYYSIIV